MLGDRFSGIQIERFSKARRIGGSGQEGTMVRQATILSTMDMVMAGLMMMDMVDKGMAGLIEKLLEWVVIPFSRGSSRPGD